MKQAVTYLALLIFFFACGQSKQKNEAAVDVDLGSITKIEEQPNGVQVALNFIKGYIGSGLSADEWVASCGMVTESFKAEYKRMVDRAWKEDPELGLGFDPIFDAQDYPDEGFELSSYDEKEGYVHLKWINFYEFELILKVVEEDGKWLVDGSGRINIPEEMLEQ